MQVKLKNVLLILPLMLSMVGAITGIMTWANLPVSAVFLDAWRESFTFAVLIMMPFGGISFLVVSKLIHKYFTACSSMQKSLLQGISMAVIMESLMAVISILNSQGYQSFTQFSGFLLHTLLYALPIGVVLSCTVSLFVKPRIEKYLLQSA